MNKQAIYQVKNAIKWIDELPNYKQAPFGSRKKLGNEELGFCCLGVCCAVLNIDYHPSDSIEPNLVNAVGLFDRFGNFKNGEFYHKASLVHINDYTHAGFKRISKLMKTKPHWMFKPEVAELITEHYRCEK